MNIRARFFPACLFLSLLALLPARAKVLDETAEIAGTTLRYRVVIPKEYDPEKTYPAILAFPPGAQTMDMVFFTMEQNWRGQAEKRGYLVFLPATPDGTMFYDRAGRVFPEFLEQILHRWKIRENRFHVAGMSNGGVSAFHIAALYPEYFVSVTGLPGYLRDDTAEHVAALSRLCLHMYVGEEDSGWRGSMEKQFADFRSRGFPVSLSVEKSQGHVMSTLAGTGAARLFDDIERDASRCR